MLRFFLYKFDYLWINNISMMSKRIEKGVWRIMIENSENNDRK